VKIKSKCKGVKAENGRIQKTTTQGGRKGAYYRGTLESYSM
jgi:hypothetical protein